VIFALYFALRVVSARILLPERSISTSLVLTCVSGVPLVTLRAGWLTFLRR
jgi:hypothetical protein